MSMQVRPAGQRGASAGALWHAVPRRGPPPVPDEPGAEAAAIAPDPHYVQRFRRLSRAAGAAVALLGVAVLAGWALDVTVLKTVVPGTVSMKPNTALALALCGASLFLDVPQARAAHRRLAHGAAALAIAIAAATLLEYAWGVPLGIDELLFREDAAPLATSHPGRMAQLTAVLFLMVGASLLLLERETRVGPPAQLIALAALTLAGLPLLAYVYLLPAMRAASATPIAPHSAAAFVVLAVGVLVARPDRGIAALCASAGPGGRLLRVLLPATLLLPAGLGAAWLAGQQKGLYGVADGAALFVAAVTALLTLVICRLAVLVERAAARERLDAVRFKVNFEQAAVGIAHVGLDGRWLRVNRRLLDIVGYAEDELLSRTFQEITHPADLDADLVHVRRLLAGEIETYSMEKRYLRKDGATLWVNLTVALVRDAGGRPQYFISVVEDIDRRKRAEAELRSIEWMLSRRPEPAAAPKPQPYGDLTALNTGRTILDAVGPDLLHDIVSDYMDLLETSSAVYEKNGDYAYGIFTSGWCQAMDYASYRGCAARDAREALACGRWHCHESCWNEASRRSIELRRPTDIECAGGIRLHAVPIVAGEEIVGSINFGYGSPPRDAARLAELSAKYGMPPDELRRNAAAYRERPAFVIDLAKRRLQGSARLIGEVVQRKRAQEALRELNADLEQRVAHRTAALEAANHELEGFSYSVSHDLRVPLRAIDGFSHRLEAQYGAQLDPEGRRLLSVVRGGAQRMSQLIDDVLAFSRLGRKEMARENVDMTQLVRDAARELATQRAARNVEITIAEMPAAQGDAAMLRQVWINLLSNAIKFTQPRAAAHIEVGGRQDADEAVYYVRDDGVGFDMQYAGKLFGVFQRLHGVEEFEGTGTGLAIVKRVITRHGGRVWAEGKVNEGATFGFALPKRVAAPAAAGRRDMEIAT